jgi:phosphatidylglycerophosphate synthase
MRSTPCYPDVFEHQLDGFLARKYKMTSVLGTILDPAADKALVATLVVTLAMQGLIPREFLIREGA